MALIHGGDLQRASSEFGIAAEDWLDLSTGISPWSWPVPPLPEAVWRRLPVAGDGLEQTAADYYGGELDRLLPVPGSQWAIETLPALCVPGPVALPVWGYEEHRAAWLAAGHETRWYHNGDDLARLLRDRSLRYAVVINPNNPSGERLTPDTLAGVAGELFRRGGLLVVDEAFADPRPGDSLAPRRPPGAVILRSLGKFFGLAGLRLGFVLADAAVVAALSDRLPPWSVSHPARWVGRRALADADWQAEQRRRLARESSGWRDTLADLFPALTFTGCELFASGLGDWHHCRAVFRAAGERGLLLRLIGPRQGKGRVRFGLPAPEDRKPALAILTQVAVAGGQRA